jgi:hypothetical protein
MLEATTTNSPTNTISSPISSNYTKSSLCPPRYPSRPTPTLTLHLSPTPAHVAAHLVQHLPQKLVFNSSPHSQLQPILHHQLQTKSCHHFSANNNTNFILYTNTSSCVNSNGNSIPYTHITTNSYPNTKTYSRHTKSGNHTSANTNSRPPSSTDLRPLH